MLLAVLLGQHFTRSPQVFLLLFLAEGMEGDLYRWGVSVVTHSFNSSTYKAEVGGFL